MSFAKENLKIYRWQGFFILEIVINFQFYCFVVTNVVYTLSTLKLQKRRSLHIQLYYMHIIYIYTLTYTYYIHIHKQIAYISCCIYHTILLFTFFLFYILCPYSMQQNLCTWQECNESQIFIIKMAIRDSLVRKLDQKMRLVSWQASGRRRRRLCFMHLFTFRVTPCCLGCKVLKHIISTSQE